MHLSSSPRPPADHTWADRVSDLIGTTPLLRLPHRGAPVLLKLEMFNPSGSAKARMARQMLDDAVASGRLPPGGHVVESTSGNTGTALAMLAAERGYRFTAVVDRHACADKLRAMQAYGAELRFVGTAGDEALATAERDALAARIAEQEGACWTAQHHNPANAAGYAPLADELWRALGPRLSHLVGAVGTGGSLCGTARVLKPRLPRLRVIGVEPVGSVLFGGPAGPYLQSGTGTPEGAEIGAVVDYSLLDEGCKVSDAQAFTTARHLARWHGLLLGGSAGGEVHQALCLARQLGPDALVVALVCDGGEKYLDTVHNDAWMQRHGLLDAALLAQLDDWLPRPASAGTAP